MLFKQKAGILKRLNDRNNETLLLESSLDELKSQVVSRKDIKQFSHNSLNKLEEIDIINAKMKKVTTRRHLVDLAKSQAEEIDFLRQELDRLRQKTFPSFVRSNKYRVTNAM